MNCLLDTHIFIWALDNNKQLKKKHKTLIENPRNQIYLSFYSLIEIAIKLNLGKLPQFKAGINDIWEEVGKMNLTLIEPEIHHLNAYELLPLFTDHRDPFDKLIIATAISEKLPILTYDSKFNLYKKTVTLL